VAEHEKSRKALLDEQQQSRAFSDESAAVVSRLEKKSAQQKAIIQKLHDQLQAMKAQLEALAMPHGSRASAAARQKGGLLDTVLHEMNKLEDSVQRL
jgi:cell division protein FtsB